MIGWIKLYRKITDSWIWEDKPYSYGQAWITLLLMANYEDAKTLVKGDFVMLEKGSILTTERDLMEIFGWSKTKTRNFLFLLEKDEKIEKIIDHKKTKLNILNWDSYQNFKTNNEPIKDQQKTIEKPMEDQQKTIEKPSTTFNNKEINKENNNIYIAEQKFSEIKIEIIDYLNEKTGKNFQHGTVKTSEVIKARLNEGFTLEDFKKVIDTKTAEWNDTDYEQYLRPETLFSNKFEGYLNQKNIRNYNGKSANNKARTIIDIQESVRDFEAVYGETCVDSSIDG